MSRSGYVDEFDDPLAHGRYRAQVASATRGRRGQSMLREMLAALDAMETKELEAGAIVKEDGCCCAIGALLKRRGREGDYIGEQVASDHRNEQIAMDLDVAECLVAEVVFENDEMDPFIWNPLADSGETRAERYWRMRTWVASLIREEPPVVDPEVSP